MHAFGLRQGIPGLDGWMIVALAALIFTSGVRWWLAGRDPLPERRLDLLSIVEAKRPGDSVVLTVVRDGRPGDVTVQLGAGE